MHSLQSLREAFAKADHRSRTLDHARQAGVAGEEYARRWMKSVGIEFEEIEQGMGTLSWALKDRQAKRPDFIWKEQDWLVLGDAKHHKTQCGKTFALRNMELEQYRSLEQWALDQPEVKNVLVVFLVFPNDLPPTAVPGSSLAIVGLYEMMNGVSTTLGNDPATRIDLAGKWAVWSG